MHTSIIHQQLSNCHSVVIRRETRVSRSPNCIPKVISRGVSGDNSNTMMEAENGWRCGEGLTAALPTNWEWGERCKRPSGVINPPLSHGVDEARGIAYRRCGSRKITTMVLGTRIGRIVPCSFTLNRLVLPPNTNIFSRNRNCRSNACRNSACWNRNLYPYGGKSAAMNDHRPRTVANAWTRAAKKVFGKNV